MLSTNDYFSEYIDKSRGIRWNNSMMERILARLIYTIDEGKTIYLIGNGGSMSTASHIACDLNYVAGRKVLKKNIKAIALDSLPTMMAIGNDEGFGLVFERQLKTLLQSDDLVIAFSGSGNSQNILIAVSYAKTQAAFTIGVTGFDGGMLHDMANLSLNIPVHDMQIVEDCHLMFGHMLMRAIVEYYRTEKMVQQYEKED